MEVKKTVRVLSILKNTPWSLFVPVPPAAPAAGGAGLGLGHEASSLWLCFSITAIKGLHCYAVCPSSVKWHRSVWSVRALLVFVWEKEKSSN